MSTAVHDPSVPGSRRNLNHQFHATEELQDQATFYWIAQLGDDCCWWLKQFVHCS